MDLKNLFSKISFDSNDREQPTKKDAPTHWIKCPECASLMFFKEVENQNIFVQNVIFIWELEQKEELRF